MRHPRNASSAVLEPGIWWLFIPILAFAMVLAWLMLAIIYAELLFVRKRCLITKNTSSYSAFGA
jgi:hypothetical protein